MIRVEVKNKDQVGIGHGGGFAQFGYNLGAYPDNFADQECQLVTGCSI
jgi:hypothetical protein